MQHTNLAQMGVPASTASSGAGRVDWDRESTADTVSMVSAQQMLYHSRQLEDALRAAQLPPPGSALPASNPSNGTAGPAAANRSPIETITLGTWLFVYDKPDEPGHRKFCWASPKTGWVL